MPFGSGSLSTSTPALDPNAAVHPGGLFGTEQPISTPIVLTGVRSQTGLNQLRGSTVAGSTGIGIPKQVMNVTAILAPASPGSTSKVTVTFQRDPSDRAYSGVVIFVKGYQGNHVATQVASGADSPLSVILNNTGESISVIVQAQGNGGSAPLSTAPTTGLTLPKNVSGGFGTGTSTNLTSTQVKQITASLPGSATLTVLPTAMPWDSSINPSFPIATGHAPIVVPISITPGQTVTIQYVSGGVIYGTLPPTPITTDLQGDPSPLGTGSLGGVFYPAHYVSGSSLKIAGLIGAFTDANGVIKSFVDLSVANTFTVPAGATQLQFGINDVFYSDNTGPGYTIAVSSQTITFENNGNFNSSQTLLNLVPGTGITITDAGSGNINISASGGGGGSSILAGVGGFGSNSQGTKVITYAQNTSVSWGPFNPFPTDTIHTASITAGHLYRVVFYFQGSGGGANLALMAAGLTGSSSRGYFVGNAGIYAVNGTSYSNIDSTGWGFSVLNDAYSQIAEVYLWVRAASNNRVWATGLGSRWAGVDDTSCDFVANALQLGYAGGTLSNIYVFDLGAVPTS